MKKRGLNVSLGRSNRPTLKELDRLWAECVKARAGYRCEYSGKKGQLNAHHIDGKPNYRLRYELENGICITNGVHFYVAHHAGRAQEFRKKALQIREIDEKFLETLRHLTGGSDLFLVKLYLEKEFKKWNTQPRASV